MTTYMIADVLIRKYWAGSHGLCPMCGNVVASWSLWSIQDQAVWVQAQTEAIVLCSKARCFTLSASFNSFVMGASEFNAEGGK